MCRDVEGERNSWAGAALGSGGGGRLGGREGRLDRELPCPPSSSPSLFIDLFKGERNSWAGAAPGTGRGGRLDRELPCPPSSSPSLFIDLFKGERNSWTLIGFFFFYLFCLRWKSASELVFFFFPFVLFMEALKNHSEAEKTLRSRINTHFDTLRSLIPGAKKVCDVVIVSLVKFWF